MVVLSVYIAILSALVVRFSYRHLAGEPRRTRFLVWMVLTAVAVQGLVWAPDFLLFLVFWLATSLGVHQLLVHYHDRPAARHVAWEKFLVSRLGDLALVGAAVLLVFPFPDTGPVVALLLVVGALTKSAQVPFHSWLPRTLEAPTPVSALLHAGLINAGALLLVKFWPLTRQEGAMTLLVVAGGLTAVWGGLCMLAQVDVKRRLAWSTVGQMGFMMVEIGLGAPALAVLHLMGHGLYKAHAFLWAGEAGVHRPEPARPWPVAWALVAWAGFSTVVLTAVALWSPHHVVLSAVVAAALLPLAGEAGRPRSLGAWALAATALAASPFVSWGAALVLGLPDALGSLPAADVAGVVTAVALGAAGLLTVLSPWLTSFAWYRQLYASALTGFGGHRWLEVLALPLGGRS